MFCSKCGSQNAEAINFCRKCGANLENAPIQVGKNSLSRKSERNDLIFGKSKDPDELTSDGIGSVIVGDGFFMVAILLSATNSQVSSLLWLFLLIPAFFFFGKGFANVLHAKQIERRLKQNKLKEGDEFSKLPPRPISFVEAFRKHTSGELVALPNVTEATTNELR